MGATVIQRPAWVTCVLLAALTAACSHDSPSKSEGGDPGGAAGAGGDRSQASGGRLSGASGESGGGGEGNENPGETGGMAGTAGTTHNAGRSGAGGIAGGPDNTGSAAGSGNSAGGVGAAGEGGKAGNSGASNGQGTAGDGGTPGSNGAAGHSGTPDSNGGAGHSGTSGGNGGVGHSGAAGGDGVAGNGGTAGDDGVAGHSGTAGNVGGAGSGGGGGTGGAMSCADQGMSCDTGDLGACAAGTITCEAELPVCTQDVQPAAEVCDGVDNDCNGIVDDGTASVAEACDTDFAGVCRSGSTTCASGHIYCLQSVFATAEVCSNGLDDDCDGLVDEEEDVDDDGDGWSVCDGDCCDRAGPCSATPELVNPGAMEVAGNQVNDDCNPATNDGATTAQCSETELFTGVTGEDVARAMDLCQFTTLKPASAAEMTWGVISAEVLRADGSIPTDVELTNMQNYQAAVLTDYGTGGIVPVGASTMAGLSSGRMRDEGDVDYVAPVGGTQFQTTTVEPPAVYTAAHGGALAPGSCGSSTCPTGSGANDSVLIRLTVRVPTNALSFSYNFRFLSGEYQNYQCSSFNDYFLALLTTGAEGIPADRNISFDPMLNPISVNNSFFQLCGGNSMNCSTCPEGTAALEGTGMEEGNYGGGTLWLTTTAPVVPGEVMTLDLTVFDVSDWSLDSLVLLDNFQWSLLPAEVGTKIR